LESSTDLNKLRTVFESIMKKTAPVFVNGNILPNVYTPVSKEPESPKLLGAGFEQQGEVDKII